MGKRSSRDALVSSSEVVATRIDDAVDRLEEAVARLVADLDEASPATPTTYQPSSESEDDK